MSHHTPPTASVPDPPAPPVPPKQLAHLVEVLELSRRSVQVPALVVQARPVATPCIAGPSLDLAVTPVPGDPCAWLGGFVVESRWSVVGLVATGSTIPTGIDGGVDAGEPVSVAFACGRDRTSAMCVRIGDGEPAVEVVGPGPRMPSGRLVDLMWRTLGLPTAPPRGRPADLVPDLWLHRVLTDATDVGPGRSGLGPRDVDRCEPHLPDSWETLRRERVAGGWPELGIHPDLAAWMDAGAFARACGEGFAERHEVLLALGDVLDPSVWRHVVSRVGDRHPSPH